MKRLGRGGLVTPLVILTLVLTTVLAMAVLNASQADYQQSALVGHGMRARELALAALEEARAVVAARTAGPDAPWKPEILTGCEARASSVTSPLPDEGQVVFSRDLARELPVSAALAAETGGQLAQAQVTFLGFRHIGYAADDRYLKDGAFYRAPDDAELEAADTRRAAHDWIGYYRLDVRASFGRAERRVSELHDVKIVSVAPPAPEFGLFSWMANGDAEARKSGLVKGGAFHLFAGGRGRAYVRGPFEVATYGFPDGTGGRHQLALTASLRPDTWWGWQAVPGPRAAVMPRENLAGLPLVAPAQGRPKMTARSLPYLGALDILLEAAIEHDPGILLQQGAQYICESKAADDRDRPFSLLGDPEATGDFELPRMIWGHTTADGKLELRGASEKITGGDSRVGNGDTPPGAGEEDRDGLYTEGDLRMTYRVATMDEVGHTNPVQEILPGFLKDTLGKFLPGEAHYRMSVAAVDHSWPYGLHHEAKKVGNLWAAIARSFAFFLDAALALSSAGVIDIGLMSGGALSEAGTLAVNASLKLEELTHTDTQKLPGTPEPGDAAALTNLLPPRWRPLGRAVTRRYASLAQVLEKSGGKLALDGVVECRALDARELLEYEGRGVLYSAAADAHLPRRVVPATGADPQTQWLTIHHEGTSDHAQDGLAMLTFEPAQADGDAIRASVYATQGVRAEGHLEIQGNLVCGFVNKHRIPRSGAVDVRYAADLLHPAGPRSLDHAAWRAVAVSQRICQSIEW